MTDPLPDPNGAPMTDPVRLAELREFLDALYGKNVAGPDDLINVRVDTLDWLVGEVERLRQGKEAEIEELSERLAAAQITIGQLSHERARLREELARLGGRGAEQVHAWVEITAPETLPDRVWMCNMHVGEEKRQAQWLDPPSNYR